MMLSILQDRGIIRLRLPYEFIIIVVSVQIILRRVISLKAAIRKRGGNNSKRFGSVRYKLGSSIISFTGG